MQFMATFMFANTEVDHRSIQHREREKGAHSRLSWRIPANCYTSTRSDEPGWLRC